MKGLLSSPAAKVIIGLLIGMGLLFLVSRFVNIAVSVHMLQQNLTTPRGIVLALLSGACFLLAFSMRGIRWKLFLNSIGNVGGAFVPAPVRVASPATFVLVTRPVGYACGLTAAHRIFCWGNNFWGQLGNGTNVSTSAALPVPDRNWNFVATGGGATCAVSGGGRVYCWGYAPLLGNGSSTSSGAPSFVPVQVLIP